MAEAAKSKTEYTAVTMTDGRVVQFPGKRRVMKETVVDTSKIVLEGDVLQVQAGAIVLRMDFISGETRSYVLPLALLTRFAGHGGEQKYGDELATTADKPLSDEDMVVAVDDLNTEIQKGNWGKGRAAGGGGVSGAATVLLAIMEASGKSLDVIKAHLQKRLDTTEGLSRRALYNSFKVPGTKTGDIYARLEAVKGAKAAPVNADTELEAIQ
jgi:hypothetical protein